MGKMRSPARRLRNLPHRRREHRPADARGGGRNFKTRNSAHGHRPVDLRFIKPLDIEGLLPVLASHSTVVTAEENALAGGVGEEIAALMKERGIAASCACAGVPDRFIAHATRAQQWEECGLTVENIMKLCGAEK